MEGELPPVVAACNGQLPVQGFRVHADTHGGDFQRPVQDRVPEEDVAVQAPVVIVRGAAVVGLAGAQRPANLHDAGSGVLPNIGVFPLGWGQVRVHVLQLLSRDKADLPL